MTLDLPVALDEQLLGVADANAETKADVIRRAIKFYLKCEEFRSHGFDAGVFRRSADGRPKDIEAVIAL